MRWRNKNNIPLIRLRTAAFPFQKISRKARSQNFIAQGPKFHQFQLQIWSLLKFIWFALSQAASSHFQGVEHKHSRLVMGGAVSLVSCLNGVKTIPFLPPMTGNGNHSTYKNADDWGMVNIINIMLFYPLYQAIFMMLLSFHLYPYIAIFNCHSMAMQRNNGDSRWYSISDMWWFIFC
jgi:hypothetical protein